MKKEKLSAGLCDTCANCQKKQIGDGVSEPFAVVPFCFARNFEVEPLPKEERILECDDYINNSPT